MESLCSFIIGAVIFGFFSAMISYQVGEGSIKDQALAAGVACYKTVGDSPRAQFSWHCAGEKK